MLKPVIKILKQK